MQPLSMINYPPIKSYLVSKDNNSYAFTIKPLLHGYGYTIGNSLRRILLSSIPGFGVTSVKINKITHEYQAVDGVMEDALDIILNIKNIRAKITNSDEKVVLTLNKNKKGEIKAGDFLAEGKAEIINSDLYICYLSKDVDLTIEIEISRGVGYLPVEKINYANNVNPQNILVDALFSPVSNVKLAVEQVRVGDRTDFDKLDLSFDTDGSVNGKETMEFALNLIKEFFNQITSSFEAGEVESEIEVKLPKTPKKTSKKETEIKLPKTILAILEKNNILTNQDLKEKRSELEEFAGITSKFLKEIDAYLKSLEN
jgi:DNA-directed RNA polymerase subunit alpha